MERGEWIWTSQKAVPKELSPFNPSGSTLERFVLRTGLYVTWLDALSMQTALSRGRSSNTICANHLTSQPPAARIPVETDWQKLWKETQEWGAHRGLRKALTHALGSSKARNMRKAVHITKEDRRGQSQRPRLADVMPFTGNVQNGKSIETKSRTALDPSRGKGKKGVMNMAFLSAVTNMS